MSKSILDLARAWFRKGDSDFENAQLCFSAGKSLDTACFHCQQAAEKWIKAFLIARQIQFPFSHDLLRLLDVCGTALPDLQSLQKCAAQLNPYAVVLRYDSEFWPDEEVVADALQAAQAFRILVIRHAPELAN